MSKLTEVDMLLTEVNFILNEFDDKKMERSKQNIKLH
jgi:hypothetical protein